MKKFALPLIAIFGFAATLVAQQPDATQPPASQAEVQPANAQGDAQQDNVVEEIVARVNNSIITRADLRRNLAQITLEARQQNLPDSEVKEREANGLRDLIDQQLLVQKAAELGISADADLVKRLDDLRKEMKVGSMEELQKLAESQGVSWEDFKQNTKNSILTQKVVGSEVGSHIQLTQDELHKYYDQHKADYTQPERVRLSEILIANDPDAPKGSPMDASPVQVAAAQAKADSIYQQLKGGANFEELAHTLSNGPTAEQGGDLGYFKRNDLAKQLEDQTFGLKSGEFTKPIRTRQGFIVLLVSDHIEAGTPPFERVREQIQDQLYTQRVQPALREYLTKLRDEAYIDIKPGYTDTGASPNQSHLIWATGSGPRTKQVRGKFGLGKKKTVLAGEDQVDQAGSASELGLAKEEADTRAKTAEKHKAAQEAAAAKKAEKEKLSHMTSRQRKEYLAEKKRKAKQAWKEAQAKQEQDEQQKTAASEQAREKARQAKLAAKKAKKQKHEAKGNQQVTPAAAAPASAEAAPNQSPSATQPQAAQKRETKAQEKARWKEEDRRDKLAKKAKQKGNKSEESAEAPQQVTPAETTSAAPAAAPAQQQATPAANSAEQSAPAPAEAAQPQLPSQTPAAQQPKVAQSPRETKAQEKKRIKEEDRQDKLAKKEAKRKAKGPAEDAKQAKEKKKEKKEATADQTNSAQSGSTEQADSKQQPEKKKKFSWF